MSKANHNVVSGCVHCEAEAHGDSHAHSHEHFHGDSHAHSHTHDHDHGDVSLKWVVVSLVALAIIVVVEYYTAWWGMEWLRTVAYCLAYLPVGLPILGEAWEVLRLERSIFNEYALMSIASIGALAIGNGREAVMLMLLYQVGEYLQGKAVHKARKDIATLADVRSQTVLRIDGEVASEIPAKEAQVGDTLRVLAGMRVSLDGDLLSESALLDQSALTGESMLVERERGDEILAGSVVSSRPVEIKVTKPYEDSTLAHIIQMTEEANERKPRTERMIRRFARIYTPIVFGLALLVVVVPWLVGLLSSSFTYYFPDWFYRALVFLVVSCPCALVISVPLTYFSGMGATSRHGLLFKGALYLEELRRVTAFVFDKTGTLTEGQFEVKEVQVSGVTQDEALGYIVALESHSRHPMAMAILRYAQGIEQLPIRHPEEVAGMGLKAESHEGEELLMGSERMMLKAGVSIPRDLAPHSDSAVLLAVGGQVVASVLLADQVKKRSGETVQGLRRLGIKQITMLSGDKAEVTAAIAKSIDIRDARGGLLPSDKMRAVETMMQQERVAFVGDGLNDAPVMSMSHIGLAMGGIGSDATIEAADVVIQGNDPYKVVEGVKIARHTHKIVIQNIIFALGFKLLVMILALFGFASLSLAIVADVGVTLLAVLNALRALYYKAH